MDLTEETSLTWEPDTSKKTACESDVSESPDYNCRNHIRVHMAVPTVTDGASLLVCGTQATRTSECRVVRVEDDGESLESFTSVDASPGIVSYYPDFSQFGEFRRGFYLHPQVCTVEPLNYGHIWEIYSGTPL